jgi:hypothetical protein
VLIHIGILLYKGERVVIRRLTQRDDHFTGFEYLAIRPSPEDFPLILRQIHGIRKVATQTIFVATLTTLFFFLATAGATFQFGSNS